MSKWQEDRNSEFCKRWCTWWFCYGCACIEPTQIWEDDPKIIGIQLTYNQQEWVFEWTLDNHYFLCICICKISGFSTATKKECDKCVYIYICTVCVYTYIHSYIDVGVIFNQLHQPIQSQYICLFTYIFPWDSPYLPTFYVVNVGARPAPDPRSASATSAAGRTSAAAHCARSASRAAWGRQFWISLEYPNCDLYQYQSHIILCIYTYNIYTIYIVYNILCTV